MTLNSNRFKYLAGIIKEDASIEEVFTSLDKKNKGIWNPETERNVEQNRAKDFHPDHKTTVDDENKTKTGITANEGLFDDDEEDRLPSPKEIDAFGTESFDDDLGEPNDIHAFLNWDKDEQEPYRQAIDTLLDKGWSDEQIVNHLKGKRNSEKETGGEWFDLTSESKTTEIREAATRFKKLAGLLKEQKMDMSPESLSPSREEEEEWLAQQAIDLEHSEEDFGGSFLSDLEAEEDWALGEPELDEQAVVPAEPKVHSIVMNILVSATDRRTAAQHVNNMIRQIADSEAQSSDPSAPRIIGPGKS
jgi:hypothetical protein